MPKLGCNFTGGLKKGAESVPSQFTDLCDLNVLAKHAFVDGVFNVQGSEPAEKPYDKAPAKDLIADGARFENFNFSFNISFSPTSL